MIINKGNKTEYLIINNINVNANLSFKLYNVNLALKDKKNLNNNSNNSEEEKDEQPILYKLRISNYKIFDEDLQILISTAKNFMKKSIKYLTHYENANVSHNLNLNEDVKDLVTSSLFQVV